MHIMNMNNNLNELSKPKKEEKEEPKEKLKEVELTENSIKSKYNNKKINELHSKKLALQKKEIDLSLLNLQKDNLMKEEQKAIDYTDYEKADNIENRIKK